MEMKVNTNVENIGRRIEQGKSAKKKAGNLSAWEEYLQKRKDQKREKKLQRKKSKSKRRNYKPRRFLMKVGEEAFFLEDRIRKRN